MSRQRGDKGDLQEAGEAGGGLIRKWGEEEVEIGMDRLTRQGNAVTSVSLQSRVEIVVLPHDREVLVPARRVLALPAISEDELIALLGDSRDVLVCESGGVGCHVGRGRWETL